MVGASLNLARPTFAIGSYYKPHYGIYGWGIVFRVALDIGGQCRTQELGPSEA